VDHHIFATIQSTFNRKWAFIFSAIVSRKQLLFLFLLHIDNKYVKIELEAFKKKGDFYAVCKY